MKRFLNYFFIVVLFTLFISISVLNVNAATKGFVKDQNGYIYYYDEKGVKQKSGWTTIDGEKYYFNKTTGAAVVGPKKIGSYYYVFDSKGAMYSNYFYANSKGQKFYLNSSGKSQEGFYSSDSQGANTYYLNGDGTFKTNQLFTVDGKKYYVSSAGLISKKGYMKIDDYHYYFDNVTGEAITGVRIGDFNGDAHRCYYFDPNTENGYRVGMQTDELGKTYIFSENNGAAYSRFYTDVANEKLYYIDPLNFEVQKDGTVECGGVIFEINSDCSLNVEKAVKINDSDSQRTQLLKYAFSQLYKPAGNTGLSNKTDFDDIPSYSCTEFVSKVYYEIGIDVGARDIIGNCYELGGKVYDKQTTEYQVGDLMFWNMTNCDERLDNNGDYWIIDADGDGVCDRIHSPNEFGDGITYHVHHESIYLGNGQMIDASGAYGVSIRNIADDTETYYVVAVMNLID